MSDLLSILGSCHVSRAFGLEARAAQTRPFGRAGRCRNKLQLRTKLLTLRAFVFIVVVVFFTCYKASRLYLYFYTLGITHAYTMTREEDLIRIAKKLDKMVSRNNTVRYLFWRLLHCCCCCCVFFPPPSSFKVSAYVSNLPGTTCRRVFVYFYCLRSCKFIIQCGVVMVGAGALWGTHMWTGVL